METGLYNYVLLEFCVDFKKNREKGKGTNFYSILEMLMR